MTEAAMVRAASARESPCWMRKSRQVSGSVIIVSASETVDGYLWYEVSSDAGAGWVAGAYLALA